MTPEWLRSVENQTRREPRRVAVEYGGTAWTYDELWRRSGAVGARLTDAGLHAGDVVAVVAGRGPDAVASFLGTIRAGGTYLAVDAGTPAPRVATMLDVAGAAFVLDAAASGDGTPETRPGVRRPAAGPPPVAYLAFTSGTTGVPKAVEIGVDSLDAHVRVVTSAYGIRDTDRVAHLASPAFDVSAEELWPTLAVGATVVIPPDALGVTGYGTFTDTVERGGVTVVNLPASYFAGWAAYLRIAGRAAPAALRLAVVGSEPLPAGAVASWFALPGPPRLINAYGVTEATVTSLVHEFSGPVDGPVPIGRPLPGTRATIAPDTGELLLGGAGLAVGYRGRPDLTAERFVVLDVDGAPRRWYRTGDLVVTTADGFAFAGRVDDQFSVNGYRIEPGDVTAAARAALPGTEARAFPLGTDLVLCVRSGTPVEPAAARAALAAVLPAYMVPTVVLTFERFPLTPGGKVDLPALQAAAARELAAPAGPDVPAGAAGVTAAALAAVCAAVLDTDVTAGDDFFGCGGDSLSAARLVTAVRHRFGRTMTAGQVFANPRIADLATVVHSGVSIVDEPAGPAATDPAGPAPLTEQQQRLWFLEQLVPGTALYNVPVLFTLDGPVDPAELARALDEVVARHPVLRTRYATAGGADRQHVDPPRPVPFGTVDARGAAERRDRALSTAARTPFDLATGPVLRAVLVRVADERYELLVTVHHIAFDGWSVGVLLTELAALYGRPGALPPPRRRYADVVTRTDEAHIGYWREALHCPPEPLELPGDRRPSGHRDRLGAKLHRPLPAGSADRVADLAAAHAASPFMVMFAAFQALLHRYTGRTDLVTGVPVAGRDHPDAAGLIGFFTNTLPLRTDLTGDPTFAGLLGRVRGVALAATAHAGVPLERIVEESEVVRDAGRNPLFDTLFVMMNVPTPVVDLDGGARLRFAAELDNGHAKFDLVLFVDRLDDVTVLTAEFATDLFDAATVGRLLGHYETLLAAATADPDTPVSRLPLLTPPELARFAAGPVPVPYPAAGVHELVAEQARAAPDAVAVEFAGDSLTYAELDRRANRLAHHLRAAGVGAETVVALCVDRSLDLPVAILAVLRAGGAYLPIDPAYPPARIALMLDEARPPVIVTHRRGAGVGAGAGSVVVLDEERATIGRRPDTPPAVDVRPDDIAYVLFTSGSTGRPKAVAQPHRMLSHLVAWHRGAGGLGDPARVLQFAALSFDVSAQEIFGTLATGGTLFMITEDERRDMGRLLALLDAARVERVFLPFAVLQHLALAARYGPVPSALRQVVAAGEQLHVTPAVAGFLTALPGAELHNHYGPTETHACSGHVLRGDPAGWPPVVPIGTALTNTVLRVLDGNGQPVPVGVPGELYVGGVGLARGYHRRPGLTADRFRPDPWTPGGRLYRTGDLVRRRADGVLEFIGRADDQVKIRGHRVEPGEVEVVLARHPGVSEAVVVPHTPPGGDRRLVAYVVAPGLAPDVAPAVLRAFAAAELPDHLVPSVFVTVDRIPLSPNGKADRRRLPDPGDAMPVDRVPERPLSTVEQAVALVWGEVLGMPVVGPDDDFFELGGHSLVATRTTSLLREVLDVEVPLRLLFAHPTLAGFAAALRVDHGAAVDVAAEEFVTVAGYSDADVEARLDEISA